MALLDRFKEKLKESRGFFISIVFHIVILFLVSGIVIINPTVRKTVFRGVLQMGGGGKAEAPSWEAPKSAPASKPVDIPQTAKSDIKFSDARVTVSNKSSTQSGVTQKVFDVAGSGGGAGGGAGAGIGKGIGAGIGLFSARMNKTEMAKKYGGTALTEVAVQRGLEYLYKTQKEDGSWDAGEGKYGTTARGAITSLAALSFLGAGYKTDSPHKYAKTIKKALEYLVSIQKENGWMGEKSGMYQHSMATMALSEGYFFGGAAGLRENVTKAAQCLLNAQKVNGDGAWQYEQNSKRADSSVTGWAIMGLKDCMYSGILEQECKEGLEKATKFIIKCNGQYEPGEIANKPNMVAVGIFCLALADKLKHPLMPGLVQRMEKSIRAKLFTKGSGTYYGLYYFNLACFQMGGKLWNEWNEYFREFIVNWQNPDGSFKCVSGDYEKQLSLNYSTAMAVLSLEVYYRYLPMYQIVNK